jgi:hypothetical protein
VVTPKTWLVVAVSLPCPTGALSKLVLIKVRRSPLAMDLHILQCRACQLRNPRLLRSSG